MSERNFVLTCGSTADMPKTFYTQRDIAYVPFHFTVNGKTYEDGSMPLGEFYRMMKEGACPTTSQINVAEYTEFFEPYLQAGKDILHVTISSALSGTHASALMAKEDLEAKYPGRKVAIVDSLGACAGYGLLMTLLADKRDAGAGLEELVAFAEEIKLRIHHWFFSTDLTAYIRGGRISKTAGLFGTLLQICPLLNMNDEGKLIPREKIRKKKFVIRAMVDRMREHAQGQTDYDGYCYVSHSASEEDAREVVRLVEEEFPALQGKVMVNDIGTVIGSHTGTGTVALFFLGDLRTR